MNTFFTLKTRLILLLFVALQLGLKAQASAIKMLDTTITQQDTTKKANSSVKITSDTTLYIRTGATIITKADTTFVINTDNKGDKALFNAPQSGAGSSTPAGVGAAPAAAVAAPAVSTGAPAADNTSSSTNSDSTTPPVTPASNSPAAITPAPNAGVTTTQKDSSLTAKSDSLKAKTDTGLMAKTDSLKAKTDTSLMAKTDSLSSDTLTNIEKRARIAFLEIGGPGLAISANYDMRFNKKNNGLGFRAGAGFFISGGNNVVTIPIQLNYLYGSGAHLIELGAGTTFLHSRGDNKGHYWQFDNITGFIGTGTIGYRYQPVGGRLNLRIAFVPILYDEGLLPIGGISVGYSF